MSPELIHTLALATINLIGFLGLRYFAKKDKLEADIAGKLGNLQGQADLLVKEIAELKTMVALIERDAKVAHKRLDEYRETFKEMRSGASQ